MIEAQNKQWKVVYTKPKKERKLATQLSRVGHEVYLPFIKTIRQWKDRKKKLEVPMFSSYLFVRLASNEEFQMRSFRDIVGFVKNKNTTCVIREEEISLIKTIEQNEIVSEIITPDVCVGQPVLINEGLFKGYTGCLTGFKGHQRIAICVESLQKVFMLELPRTHIEPC